MKKFAFAAASLAAFVAVPAQAALLANGNFETGTFANWTATGNVEVVTIPYFGLADARYGRYVAAFNGGDRAPNGTLTRNEATAAGIVYDLGFDFGVTSGGDQTIRLELLNNGTVFAAQAFRSTTGFQQFNLRFTALSGTTTIRFSDVATNSTISQDGGLDNVSLTGAVPEPATWGLMLAGFGLVGAAARTRRRAVRFA